MRSVREFPISAARSCGVTDRTRRNLQGDFTAGRIPVRRRLPVAIGPCNAPLHTAEDRGHCRSPTSPRHRARPGRRHTRRSSLRREPPRACSRHPRAGGEHGRSATITAATFGSSPRGRGTQRGFSGRSPVGRFIPARAGNTSPSTLIDGSKTVHPRAGGEHGYKAGMSKRCHGSSPRGRGTHPGLPVHHQQPRFIPARAGNTLSRDDRADSTTVHPRAGGEHIPSASASAIVCGSSPRGRGTLQGRPSVLGHVRFIPARAGNTANRVAMPSISPVHPRAGGEHKLRALEQRGAAGSSPRGRGTHELASVRQKTYN